MFTTLVQKAVCHNIPCSWWKSYIPGLTCHCFVLYEEYKLLLEINPFKDHTIAMRKALMATILKYKQMDQTCWIHRHEIEQQESMGTFTFTPGNRPIHQPG